jgi:hypothetical protein
MRARRGAAVPEAHFDCVSLGRADAKKYLLNDPILAVLGSNALFELVDIDVQGDFSRGDAPGA